MGSGGGFLALDEEASAGGAGGGPGGQGAGDRGVVVGPDGDGAGPRSTGPAGSARRSERNRPPLTGQPTPSEFHLEGGLKREPQAGALTQWS